MYKKKKKENVNTIWKLCLNVYAVKGNWQMNKLDKTYSNKLLMLLHHGHKYRTVDKWVGEYEFSSVISVLTLLVYESQYTEDM